MSASQRAGLATEGNPRASGPLDAFQNAFAAYLARTGTLQGLREAIERCVRHDRGLGHVVRGSLAAALQARCLPRTAYRALISAVETRLPGADAPPGGMDVDRRLLCDRFELRERVAEGGIGTLYRAIDLAHPTDRRLDRPIAVKLLSDEYRFDPDALFSLQREVRAGRRLAHPNIRKVYDLDRCSTDVFVTMEWLEGESLARRLDRTGSRPMAWSAAYGILRAVGAGLTHAHERNVVHGDVKPANVFITIAGEIKLLDFGQSRHVAADGRPVGKLSLSPAYASCEMHEGATPESGDDIFALAVMAYRMLAGARPFGRYTALQAEQADIRALRPVGLGARQWQALRHGMAWRRDRRPTTVADFLAELMPSTEPHGPKLDLHAAA